MTWGTTTRARHCDPEVPVSLGACDPGATASVLSSPCIASLSVRAAHSLYGSLCRAVPMVNARYRVGGTECMLGV